MSSFSRFRGTHRLASSEAARIVLQILRETPETRQHDRQKLADYVREVEDSGVGDPTELDPAGGGYRQVLAVLTGVLLKLAGANTEAIRQAVAGRTGKDLERLISAILARMGQMEEQGEPVRKLETSMGADLATVSDAGTEDDDEQFGVMLPPEDEDDLGESNPALSYLVDLADGPIRRVVRNVDRGWDSANSRLPFGSESASYSRQAAFVEPASVGAQATPVSVSASGGRAVSITPAASVVAAIEQAVEAQEFSRSSSVKRLSEQTAAAEFSRSGSVQRLSEQTAAAGFSRSGSVRRLSEQTASASGTHRSEMRTPAMGGVPMAGVMRKGSGAHPAMSVGTSAPAPKGGVPLPESGRSEVVKSTRVTAITPLSVIVASGGEDEEAAATIEYAGDSMYSVPGSVRLAIVGGVTLHSHKSALARFRGATERERLISAFTAALDRHFEGDSNE